MKNLLYKGHLFYLFLLSIITYSSVYSAKMSIFSLSLISLQMIATNLILFINSSLIFTVANNFLKNKWASFALASLYLVTPLHIGNFIYSFQLQSIIAELFLLLSIVFYFKEKNWKALVFLVVASIFNTQLLAFFPFVCFLHNIKKEQKIILITHLAVSFIYIFSQYHELGFFYQVNYKTIFYTISAFLLPFNLPIINYAVVDPDFSGVYQLVISLCVLFFCFFKYKNKENERNIIFLVSSLFLSTLLPFKSIVPIKYGYYFYFNPSFYPVLFYLVLTGLAFYFIKTNYSRISFLPFIVLGLFFLVMNKDIQETMANKVTSWETSLSKLPQSYNFEERIKRNYVDILMDKKMYNEAEAVAYAAKIKFNKPVWYSILIKIALVKKDGKAMEQLKSELFSNGVPIEGPDLQLK